MLWVLAQAIPWLAKEVSLPHFDKKSENFLSLDASVAWAVASQKKSVMLGVVVGQGTLPINALVPALAINSKWGHRLAIECML